MIKKLFIFIFFGFVINVCHADKFITFDTLALYEAMKEITKISTDSKYKTIEEAQEALYDVFYTAKIENNVDIDKVVDKCVNEIVLKGSICTKFIVSYNTYLDKANYCLKANRERTIPDPDMTGEINKKEFTFQDCLSAISAHKVFDKTTQSYVYKSFTGDSYIGKCVDWVESAQQCQIYLISYYQDKLNEASDQDKRYYKCLLEKVQTGNMDFPISKMENACH